MGNSCRRSFVRLFVLRTDVVVDIDVDFSAYYIFLRRLFSQFDFVYIDHGPSVGLGFGCL